MRKKTVLTSVMAGAAALALSLGGAGAAQAASGDPTATAIGAQGAWNYSQNKLYVQDNKADGRYAVAFLDQWQRGADGRWSWVSLGYVFDKNGANGDSPSVYIPKSKIRFGADRGNLRVLVGAVDPATDQAKTAGASTEFRSY